MPWSLFDAKSFPATHDPGAAACMNARQPVLEHSQHKRDCEAPWANSGREVEAYLARVGVGEKSQQARPVWALNGSSCSHANPRKQQ